MKISRRQFSRSLGVGLAGIACTGAVGSHGKPSTSRVSGGGNSPFPRLGFDGFFVGQRSVEQARAVLETAVEEGFVYFDNAATYIEGRAERRYGFCLTPRYRDRIFLQSRAKPRTKRVARADIDLALARHQTDYLDSFLMNSLVYYHRDHQVELPDEDVFEALIEAKQAGKLRFIGIRAEVGTDELCGLLGQYGEQVDCIMLPFALPESDRAYSMAQKLAIPVVGGLDEEVQSAALDAKRPEDLLPSRMASRILRLSDPDAVRSYARAARDVIGGLA